MPETASPVDWLGAELPSGLIYFARHGVSEPNLRGVRCGGDVDAPLAEAGIEQAFALARSVRRLDLDIGIILTGRLTRLRQTALIVSGALNALPITTDALLDERRLGDWNGRGIAETEAPLAAGVTPPGGEAEEEFVARIAAALMAIRFHLPCRPLIVGSKGVGRVIHALLGGRDRLALHNGELVEFAWSPALDGSSRLTMRRLFRPENAGEALRR